MGATLLTLLSLYFPCTTSPSQRLSSHPSVSYPETSISLSPIQGRRSTPDSTSFPNIDPPLDYPQPSYSSSTRALTSQPHPLPLDADRVTFSNNLTSSIAFPQTHDSLGQQVPPLPATSAGSAPTTIMSHDLSAHLDPTLEVVDSTSEDHTYGRENRGGGMDPGSAEGSGMVWRSSILSDIETAELVKL